jgi:SHS2 domain-containing protein
VTTGERSVGGSDGDRGHRAVEHTADEIVEAWGPTRGVCLEETVLGFTALVAVPDPAAGSRPLAVTLDADDDPELLVALLAELVYLLDVEEVVPAGVVVDDRGTSVVVRLTLSDVAAAEQVGPAPKGISRSGLTLAPVGTGWRARAIVDI